MFFSSFYAFTFTFMHLANAFIQSDLQCIQVIHFLSVCNGIHQLKHPVFVKITTKLFNDYIEAVPVISCQAAECSSLSMVALAVLYGQHGQCPYSGMQ